MPEPLPVDAVRHQSTKAELATTHREHERIATDADRVLQDYANGDRSLRVVVRRR